jgi:DNA-binding IclR family transcriptional regulator
VTTAQGADGSGTTSAERVADVLLAFGRGRASIGVSALSRELGLSKTVVHRILQSLRSRGFVELDPQLREYRLGPAATALGARAVRQLDLRDVAREPLMRLRDATGETTTLSVLAGQNRAYVDQYESPREIRMTVELSRLYPLHAGSSSRAMLAFLPRSESDRIIGAGLGQITGETIVQPDALRRNLAEVRARGYATSRGERQAGAGSLAAPLFDARGVVGAISVCGPLARFDPETVRRYAPALVAAAHEISTALGAAGGPAAAGEG